MLYFLPSSTRLLGLSFTLGAAACCLVCLAAPVLGQSPARRTSVGEHRADEREAGLSAAISNAVSASQGASQVAVSVVDLDAARNVVSIAESEALKPASVLKILTALVALQQLGPQYRFKTGIFIDDLKSGEVKRLYVRGGADPDLTIENALLMAREVRKRGVARVGRIIVDSSRLLDPAAASGARAYESGSSALAFNHNAVEFTICPASPGKAARVAFDPFELPIKLTGQVKTGEGLSGAVSIEMRRQGAQPVFELGGKIGTLADCAVIFRSLDHPEKVFARVFTAQLEAAGVKVEKPAEAGQVPDRALLLYEHQSKSLKHIVEDLNHFSSNFIAEQILAALGENPHGLMSRSAGLARLKGYLLQLGFEGQFRLEDASGLSHENRLSAGAITSLLRLAYRDVKVGPEFVGSLPVAEESGTLRKRSFGLADSVVRAKTGTIDNVSSLAGFVFNRRGTGYAFAVLQNGVKSKAEAVKLENVITALIAAH